MHKLISTLSWMESELAEAEMLAAAKIRPGDNTHWRDLHARRAEWLRRDIAELRQRTARAVTER